jgi:hypothetical protein
MGVYVNKLNKNGLAFVTACEQKFGSEAIITRASA